MRIHKQLATGAYTLIELSLVIAILGILAAATVPKIGDIIKNSRIKATQSEMQQIRGAIVGNPDRTSGGEYIDRGYLGDVGSAPTFLTQLITKPSGVDDYDYYARTGWNGPYLDDDGTGNDTTDAWGIPYVITGSILRSYGPDKASGGGDDIDLQFQ